MKKLFTLILAFVALTASAATIDDVKVCKHSYVLVMDEWTANGTSRPGKGALFGDGYFLDVTGGSVATNKGKANPSEMVVDATGVESYRYGEAFATKYADVPACLNSLRIKNKQDVIAMKVTAGSKLIFILNGNNKVGTAARIPCIATDRDLVNTLNKKPGADHEATPAGFKYEWTSTDDQTIYIGSYNGDTFIGLLIVEANEAPGTPSVKVGEQMFEQGVFYRDITCKPNKYELFGQIFNTVVTYTTDGTVPTASSKVYKEPIRCYDNTTVKFKAFVDFGDGMPAEECPNADNEAVASFLFNAPAIAFDKATKTVSFSSEYETLGANVEYYYSYNDVVDAKGAKFEIPKSATVSAYAKIINGSHATFTTNATTADIITLAPLASEKTIQVTAGTAVKDEIASAEQGKDLYMIEGGAISADENDFFVKNLTFGALANVDATLAQYQVPAGQEAYIKMSNTNITFVLDKSAAVVVTCSKNACKNIESANVSDRQCKVNVSGTVYGSDDILVNYDLMNPDGTVVENLPGNIIKFDLEAGEHTFQKFSGTGNILISSIVITPGKSVFTGIAGVEAADEVGTAKAVKYAKDGRLFIKKGDKVYSASGAEIK